MALSQKPLAISLDPDKNTTISTPVTQRSGPIIACYYVSRGRLLYFAFHCFTPLQ